MKRSSKVPFSSIQSRITLVMAVVLAIVLLVNIFVFRQSSSMVRRAGRIFETNSTIIKLSETLRSTQQSLYAYLSTKSSGSLEDFYRYEQEVKDRTETLNDQNVSDATLMLEKNIREMSDAYLDTAEDAVQARRARDVEEYKENYGRAFSLYGYINSYIYALNNTRFEQNTESYQVLLKAMNVMEHSSIGIILAAIVLALAAAAFSIRDMVRPLRNLAKSADRVAAGDFDTEIPESSLHDEIGTVTNAFRGMLISIREYIERQRDSMETEARLKETEARMKENEIGRAHV